MAEEAELDAAWRAYCLEQCDALAALRGYSVLAAIVDAAHVSLSEQTESVEAWTAGRLVVPSDGVTG
jgi:uncharacterized protein YcnI